MRERAREKTKEHKKQLNFKFKARKKKSIEANQKCIQQENI